MAATELSSSKADQSCSNAVSTRWRRTAVDQADSDEQGGRLGLIRLSREALFPTALPLATQTVVHSGSSHPVVAEGVKLIFVTEGRGRLRTGSGTIDLAAGSIVVLPAGAWCATEPFHHVEMVTLYLHPVFAESQVTWMPDVHPLTYHLQVATSGDEAAGALYLGGAAMAALRPRLVSLSEHSLTVADHFAVYADLANLFSDIGRVAGHDSPVITTAERSLQSVRQEVADAMWLLREDPGRRWSVRALASEVSLSVSQLTRLFHEGLGIGPAAFLRNLRIDRMAIQLLEDQLSVAAASRATGWSSRSAASRAFKRRYGVSPSSFARERAQRLLTPDSK